MSDISPDKPSNSIVGLRDLSRRTREVIEQLEIDGEPVVITRHGKPIALLSGVAENQMAALALASVPELRDRRDQAAEEIAAGEGEPAAALLAEMEAEPEEEPQVGSIGTSNWLDQQVRVLIDERLAAEDLSSDERQSFEEYVSTLVESYLLAAVERARTVNRNLLTEVENKTDESGERIYLNKIRALTDAERLTRGPVKAE